MSLGQLAHELDQTRQDATRLEGKPEHLANLPQDDADSDAVHEPDQYRLAEKLSQEAETKQAGADADQTGQHRE